MLSALLFAFDNEFVTSGDDATIRIWDARAFEIKKVRPLSCPLLPSPGHTGNNEHLSLLVMPLLPSLSWYMGDL